MCGLIVREIPPTVVMLPWKINRVVEVSSEVNRAIQTRVNQTKVPIPVNKINSRDKLINLAIENFDDLK